MIDLSDKKLLLEIVADSVAQTHLTFKKRSLRDRWIKAIAKAASVIMEGETTFLHWDPFTGTLHFWSSESNEIYQTTDSCQCPAFLQPKPLPCYHRAMRQIIRNYFAFLGRPGEIRQIDFADDVFFAPDLSIRDKIRLLNLSIIEGRIELIPRVKALRKFDNLQA